MNPYYAVIFTSTLRNDEGYLEMAEKMEALAKEQPGYLGFESARGEIGVTISYWESPEHIASWKSNLDHLAAQKNGMEKWYKWYKVRVCKVEREYDFTAD